MKELTLNVDLLRDSGIPKPYFNLGSDTYQGNREALKKIEKYVKKSFEALNERIGIFISGPRHTYKTFLATYALKCLLSQGYVASYTSLDKLTFKFFEKGQSSLFSSFVEEPDFLVIDNCDASGDKGDALALETAIRLRKDEGNPIFIVSNLRLEAFEKRYREEAYDYVKNRTYQIDTSIDPARKDYLKRKAKADWD